MEWIGLFTHLDLDGCLTGSSYPLFEFLLTSLDRHLKIDIFKSSNVGWETPALHPIGREACFQKSMIRFFHESYR